MLMLLYVLLFLFIPYNPRLYWFSPFSTNASNNHVPIVLPLTGDWSFCCPVLYSIFCNLAVDITVTFDCWRLLLILLLSLLVELNVIQTGSFCSIPSKSSRDIRIWAIICMHMRSPYKIEQLFKHTHFYQPSHVCQENIVMAYGLNKFSSYLEITDSYQFYLFVISSYFHIILWKISNHQHTSVAVAPREDTQETHKKQLRLSKGINVFLKRLIFILSWIGLRCRILPLTGFV